MIVLPIQKQEQKTRNHQATAMFSWDNPGLLQSSHGGQRDSGIQALNWGPRACINLI